MAFSTMISFWDCKWEALFCSVFPLRDWFQLTLTEGESLCFMAPHKWGFTSFDSHSPFVSHLHETIIWNHPLVWDQLYNLVPGPPRDTKLSPDLMLVGPKNSHFYSSLEWHLSGDLYCFHLTIYLFFAFLKNPRCSPRLQISMPVKPNQVSILFWWGEGCFGVYMCIFFSLSLCYGLVF